MKIVNLETYYSLPKGTIYCEYFNLMFGDLSVKIDNDRSITLMPYFFTLDISDDNDMVWDIEFTKFEKDQEFAIFEKKEIKHMINLLKGGFMHLEKGYVAEIKVDNEKVRMEVVDETTKEFIMEHEIIHIYDKEGVCLF